MKKIEKNTTVQDETVQNDIHVDEERVNNYFVSLQNIEKIYPNGAKAVYNFNLDINKHEFIVIVGPSGCGKSTTLRMIGGLEDITDGFLFIDKDLSNFKQSKDRKIAMVFQSYALYPQMTVYENIAFPLQINKYPREVKDENGNVVLDENGNPKIEYVKYTKKEIDERVFEAARILDLGEYLDRLPKQLSGGQMQRVALGRAIVKNVPLFLMDEPLSNLDAKLRLTMRSEIVKLHNKIGATTIYVTHDQTEAMTMASRIVVMSKGFIQQIASPEEVYNNPANLFVAKFIGSPSINIFNGSCDNDGNLVINNDIKLEMPKSFKERVLKFYQNKIKEFEQHIENFTIESAEYIKKILSALADENVKAPITIGKKKKKNKKEKVNYKDISGDKLIAEEKLAQLKNSLEDNKLILGIRPERIKIKRITKSTKKEYPIVVEATVCELLGADYNVHFDLFGKDMIGKLDAKTPLTEGDKLAVEFSPEDIFFFDPITGERI